jgi:hypothetical protein
MIIASVCHAILEVASQLIFDQFQLLDTVLTVKQCLLAPFNRLSFIFEELGDWLALDQRFTR